MARPRRHRQSPPTDASDATETPRPPAPHDAEREAQERLADVLIALVGEHLRDRIDPMDPGMAQYWEWKAKQARDALTPAERVVLQREARAFARAMKAELEALRRAGMLDERDAGSEEQ